MGYQMLGTIYADGVLDISLKKPTSSVSNKTRKVDGKMIPVKGKVAT